MIDAAERKGFQLAVASHLVLFGLLSLSLMLRSSPKHLPQESMDVSLVGPIGLRDAMPKPSVEPPAESQAPEQGPSAEAVAQPEPQPAPAPKLEPAPTPKPSPVAAPKKPAPPKREKLTDDLLKDIQDRTAKEKKAKGARLGADFLKGITAEKTGGRSQTPRATLSGIQMRGLASAIRAQVLPCYVIPTGGPDITQIVSTLHLRFNPDGSTAGTPDVIDHSGVTDSNRNYVRQMDDAATRAILRCSPLKLPAELYEGGWEDITFDFRPQSMR